MNIRKMLALLLVLAMLSALIACGSDAKKEEPTTEPTTTEPVTTEPTTEAPTTEAPTTEEPTTESTADEEVSIRGEVNGNTYINRAIDCAVTLGSEWTIADEAALAQLAGLTSELIDYERAKEMIENGQTVFDFNATKDGGLSSININITFNNVSGMDSLDEETLLNLSKEQTKTVLEASGYENLNVEIVPITFAGEDHYCMALTSTFNGMTIYQYSVMLLTDSYIYAIATTSCNEDLAAGYLALFTKVDEAATNPETERLAGHEIIGTWRYDMPFAEMMEQALLITGFECDVADDTVLEMTLTFNEDGTCVAKADAESAKAMLEEMLRAMSTVMGDMLYAEFEKQQGWDKATTDAQLEAQGLTMAALVEQSMAQVDTSSFDISSSFESESYYMVEGDVYYTASTMEDLLAGKYTESMQFVIDGDQMQFLDCELYNEDAVSLEELVTFPITLTRE